MKTTKYLVAVLVLLISFSSCTEKQKNGWQKEKLRGKVKSYVLRQYEVVKDSSGIKKGKEREQRKTTYNRDGKLKSIHFKPQKKNYIQALLGRQIEYYYDENGYIVEMHMCSQDTLSGIAKMKNDEKGYCTEVIYYNLDGTRWLKTTDKNDGNGNVLERKFYDKDEKLEYLVLYKYDKKGNEIESTRHDADGNLMNKYEYEYDKYGNKIRQKNYRMDNDSLKLQFEITNKYEFDKKGNWIKNFVYKNDEPIFIFEREYEYYE